MIMNKKVLYAASLLTVAYAPLMSVAQADMNMKKALELTANTNPQIKATESNALAREKVIRQAEAGYLPKLDASFSAGPERTRQKINPNPASRALDFGATEYRRNPAINASQMVFDGWKTRSDVDRATTDYIQGTKKTDETNEQLSYRAAAAYIKVRRFQRLRREAERNLSAHKEIAGVVAELIKSGRASTADRATVDARIATATNAVTDIQGDLDDATAEFKALVGVEPDRLVSAKIPDSYLPACVNDAIAVARQKNKSVILTRASLDVALAQLNVVDAAFYPRITIEANANRAKNNAGEKGRIDIYNVLGVVRYNIYNGGADSAKVAEITEKIAEQRYLVDQELRTAEEEVRRSWAQKVSSTANAIQQRKAVVALREEMDAFKKQYKLGTRTLIDVLGSINEYFLARGALITSDAAQDTSETRLLASMGVLTESFGTAIPSPNLYSDKGVTSQAIKYSHEHCNMKGGLPQAEIVDLPTKEPVLTKVAHTTSGEEENGFFGDFLNNLTSSEQASSPTTHSEAKAVVHSTATPALTAKAQDDDSFFSGFMTNLASTEPSKNSADSEKNQAASPAQKASTEEDEAFFSGFLSNLASTEPVSTSSPAVTAPQQPVKPVVAKSQPSKPASNANRKAGKENADPSQKATLKQTAVKKHGGASKAQNATDKTAQTAASQAQAPQADAHTDDTAGSWLTSMFSAEETTSPSN